MKEAYEYIGENSVVNAEKVLDDILNATSELAKHPEKYPPDKYKRNNPGNYRAFEIHNY